MYNKLKKEKLENSHGITLVALVVTIVVLLILAGVSINLVVGDNGIITKAREARKSSEEMNIDEQDKIAKIENYLYNETQTLPQTEQTKPYMPTNEFYKVEGTDLNNGLVIADANGNQYVWIEVPMAEEVYKNTKLNATNFTDETYQKIEEDLYQYSIAYAKNKQDAETTFKDEYVEDETEGGFKNKDEYNAQKNKMLKSIYQNGGFWISRYEAGTEEYRYSNSAKMEKPKFQEGLYPYIYVNKIQAKVLAEQIKYGENTGSLLFGLQWNLILAFIHNKGNVADEIINNNSEKIGNYFDATFKIDRGKYTTYGNLITFYDNVEDLDGIVSKQIKNKQILAIDGIMLTTGAADRNKIMNIYDIAGNLWEWTLEKSSDEEEPSVFRGGSYNHSGEEAPLAWHSKRNTDFRGNTVSFRISIY